MADVDKKKKTPGQYTHWGRPKWLRMYEYNYEYGESYYRPQVRYISTSRATYETSSAVELRSAYQARRSAMPPPRAQSFIERWTEEPFYGYGYGFGMDSSARAQSRARELSSHRSSIASSDMRSRRAQSEMKSSSTNINSTSIKSSTTSNYASKSLLEQMKSVKSSSIAVQQESASYESQIRQRRARSVEASMMSSSQGYYGSARNASDDCLMRSTALESSSSRASSVARSRREQSESRYAREGSLTKTTLGVDENVLKGQTLDGSCNYEYPLHHLVCTEKCPMFTDPVHHRRFVIGNKFNDAAALGGFDVLYDPTVYKKTRKLLERFSQERQIEATIYESSRETESQSKGIYAYGTRY